MKFTITAKNPDGIEDSIRRAAEEAVDMEAEDEGATGRTLEPLERQILIEDKIEELWEECKKFVEYKEYVRIEVDTETGTATVLEV